MSSAGQILGGIAGGVIGFPSGNLFLGAQIGMSLGGLVDPPKGPTAVGPRLDDLTVQSSTYGAPIPRIYGAVTVVGNVIWLENNRLKETVTKKKSGGKGSGSKTTTKTYSYSATFAVALCKGPIVGIRRLWIRSDLVYDAGSSDPNTIAASNQSAAGWTLYKGTDTQAADPRMQATLGVANTPAWRGLAYLVFQDLALAKYANSLMGAQIKAEVMTLGATYTYPYTTFTQPNQNWRQPAWDGTVFCTVAYFAHLAATSSDGLTWATYSIPNGNSATYQGCASDGAGVLLAYGAGVSTNMWRSVDHGQTWTAYTLPGFNGYVTQVEWNGSYFLAITDTGPFFKSPNGVTWTAETAPASGSFSRSLSWHPGSSKWYVCTQFGADPVIYSSATGGAGTWSIAYTLTGDLNNFDQSCVHKGRILYLGVGTVSSYAPCVVWSDDGTTWAKINVPMRQYYILSDGTMCWVGDSNGAMYYSPDGVTGWTSWTGPAQAINHMAIYANSYIVCLGSGGTAGYRISRSYVAPIAPTLDTVVSAECLQSGLLSGGDVDVTALTSSVRGYRIGSVGTLRSALEPLQASWPFDVVQRGYKLTFKPRGGASVATIAAGDFDARGTSQEPGVQITQAREVDSQLPRRLTVRYLDSAREYDAGSQYAERLSSSTIRETVVDLPIVLDAAEAAGKAEVLLYAAWLARLQISFNLPATYLHLEPADVVTLPTPEGSITVRLTNVNYTSDNRVECRATLERAAVYTPAALGVAPGTTGPTTLTPLGPSTYALLDLPRLGSSQDGVGFPVAMCGADSAWPGGALMRSADAGATWDQPLDFAPPGATIGVATTTIGVVESRLIDAASRLTVTLTSGTLSDVSELAMLAGANHFAYGAAGRWEIIAARSCTLQSGSTYILSNLLRGRFGSEWAMGLHATSDVVVLLDSADLQVLPLTNADIGAARLFRAITSGRDFSTDSDRAMTYAAVNLKPLSPVLLNGSRDPGTADWSLTWTRRTRKGGEWLDGVDAELGEAAEAYDIEVYADGSYATLKRTITASSPSCAYSSADQVTDFGGNQSTLYLKVYQRSATVGRGYPLTTAITR